MLTEAQEFYLHDVLGVSAAYFAKPVTHQALVLTPALSEEARQLLEKILASAGLQQTLVLELSEEKIPDELESSGLVPPLVLSFWGTGWGRQAHSEREYWSFCRVDDMLPAHPEMQGNKKKAWTTLQQIQLKA